MSVTISVRVEDHIKREIEDLGYAPGEYLKLVLERELRRERSRKALVWIKKHRVPSKGELAEQLVRKARDMR
ncbi:MAG: hypothetical protein QF415_02530 [Candidatus Undinarchaeales archaeon]|jgi:hypothetical protein|nr:hypothetical protein [Candidatus Undinarchaeales archaeon]MDP7492281.1 hypothetical protein [Candidatus Undinarchaeales archaeon]